MLPESIETERLNLRQFTLADAEFIIQLLNSPGWLKYIGDKKVKTTLEARHYLQTGPFKSYKENGFGLGLVSLKPRNIPIGMCGLIKRSDLPNPDLGFAFLPEFMGLGYAREIALKTVGTGFTTLNLKKILAITLPGNKHSIHLLEKIGFRVDGFYSPADKAEQLLLFSLSNSEKN